MRCLVDKERRGEGMVVVKETFRQKEQHENQKMTCHRKHREASSLHTDGAREIKSLVRSLAVGRHSLLCVLNKSYLLSCGILKGTVQPPKQIGGYFKVPGES